MSVYLGIDSGTQGTKAVAIDLERARVIATARAPHRLISGLPMGHAEQHPEDWVRALTRVLLELGKQIPRERVRGIGISGQQHGFVPLDAKGEVIRPAKLWCDTSASEECEMLTSALGGQAAVIRHTGLPFLPGYTAAKILWLKRREPAHWRRLRHVLLPHDYLNFHLTGKYFMEYGDASGTALMDVRRRRWSQPVMTAIDRNLVEMLPALSGSNRIAGILRPVLARRFGFSGDVVVSAGGGDNMMGAIGTGNVEPGVVTASLGTSGTIYATSQHPVVDPRGEIAAFCSSTNAWLPLICTMNVTLVTEHLRALFNQDHQQFSRSVASVPIGSGGLHFLPYLDGERTPNMPHARGVLAGMTRCNLSGPHIARAGIEGVTYGLNYGLRRLRKLGVIPAEIRLIGGGANSKVWRQIVADVFGVPVVCMAATEAAALGGALQAAWCVEQESGSRQSLAKICARFVRPDQTTRCVPNVKSHGRYNQLQQEHDQLRETMCGR